MATTNRVVIEFADGRELCTSYGVPVAGFVPGRGYLKTEAKYSVTTSRHVNSYAGADAPALPDAEFRALFADVHKAEVR